MKLNRVVLAALPFVLLTGCFTSNPFEFPDTPDPWMTPNNEGALWVEDMAIDAETGNIYILGSDWNGSVIQILDSELNVTDTVTTDAWGMSITAPRADGRVMVSDGSWSHVLVDLGTGATTTVSGFEPINSYPAAFMTGADTNNDGLEESVISVPCELSGDDPMQKFDNDDDDDDVVLSSSIPLTASGMSGVNDVTFAPDLNVLFALSYDGPVGIDANTGERVVEFGWNELDDADAIAYDVRSGRLLVSDWNGNLYFYDL